MNLLKSIFLSPEIRVKVKEIHDSFPDIKLTSGTLMDYAIMPHKASKEMWDKVSSSIKRDISNEMLEQHPEFSQFEIYDMPACKYMAQRSKLVNINDRVIELMQEDISDITVLDLEYISSFAHSPMTAFWLKHAVLRLGFEDTYQGLQPYTKPVDEATKRLYGHLMTQFRHTLLCSSLSKELEVSMCHINTVLWIQGSGY